jgi:hypothetical protein
VYGTRSAATAGTGNQQTLTIDGGSGFSGVIYAPNANTTFNGGGDILGAVVCNLATLNGGAHFHYDLALASFGGGSSTNNISKYRELESAGDRALYAAQLNF